MTTTLIKQPEVSATAGTGRIFKILGALTVALGFAVGVAGPAHAVNINIVTNGGFETGDFTGWTPTGDQTFNGVQCPGPSSVVFEGNCSAFFGPVGTHGGIAQDLNTVPGLPYSISFAFQGDSGVPSDFSASFGGVSLISLTNPATGPFQVFGFDVVATSAITTLAFNFRDDPGFLNLDAVSVSVPEPATVALLGISLAGLWAGRRRKAQ